MNVYIFAAVALGASAHVFAQTYSAETFEAAARANGLKGKRDEFRNVTIYKPASAPRYINVNAVYAFLVTRPNVRPMIRLKMQYAADSWLFIKDAKFLVDGQVRALPLDGWERDHDSGVWEWVDVEVDPVNVEILEEIAKAKTVVIRYDGRQYFKDRRLSQAEQVGIGRVASAYRQMSK